MHAAGSELDNAALTEVRRNFHALPDEFEFKPSTVKLGAIGVFCRQTLGKGKREMRCLMCSGNDCIDPPACTCCTLDVDNKFCVYAPSTTAILLLIYNYCDFSQLTLVFNVYILRRIQTGTISRKRSNRSGRRLQYGRPLGGKRTTIARPLTKLPPCNFILISYKIK